MQQFDSGGDPVGPASDRAIHFNAMNPTGYAQIVEELVPDGGGGWQVARTSTIGRDVISTSAASGDRGLLHSYDPDAPMAMLYDAGGSVRALFSPEPGAGSFSPAFGELDDDPNRIDDDDAAVRVQVFDYDAFGQLIRVTAGIGGPSNGPPAIDPGGVPAWRFAANTPNSEFAAAHANFSLSTLLYRGEQFDTHLRMQYLRARHYDQATGRFTRLDPFAGVPGEPLTLHKYAYALADGINALDPSGLFTVTEVVANLHTIVNVFLRSLNVVHRVVQIKDAVGTFVDVLSFLSRASHAIGVGLAASSAPGAGTVGQRFFGGVAQALRIDLSRAPLFMVGMNQAFRHIGKRWTEYRDLLMSNMGRMVADVAKESGSLLQSGIASKDRTLVFTLPSPPDGVPWPGIPGIDVPVGRHDTIRIMSHTKPGRLFQIGMDFANRKHDPGITNILRVDYQIFQNRPHGQRAHDGLEYHPGPNGTHVTLP